MAANVLSRGVRTPSPTLPPKIFYGTPSIYDDVIRLMNSSRKVHLYETAYVTIYGILTSIGPVLIKIVKNIKVSRFNLINLAGQPKEVVVLDALNKNPTTVGLVPKLYSSFEYDHVGQRDIVIAMEWFNNAIPLTQFVELQKRSGHYNKATFNKLKILLFNALEKLHSANIVHRDIHPDNILIDLSSHTVKFIDLELAVPNKTVDRPIGKEGYMSFAVQAARESRSRMHTYTFKDNINSLRIILQEIKPSNNNTVYYNREKNIKNYYNRETAAQALLNLSKPPSPPAPLGSKGVPMLRF